MEGGIGRPTSRKNSAQVGLGQADRVQYRAEVRVRLAERLHDAGDAAIAGASGPSSRGAVEQRATLAPEPVQHVGAGERRTLRHRRGHQPGCPRAASSGGRGLPPSRTPGPRSPAPAPDSKAETARGLGRPRRARRPVLDSGLPGMDGYEVARQIRDLLGGKGILLVAMTGWDSSKTGRRRPRRALLCTSPSLPTPMISKGCSRIGRGQRRTPAWRRSRPGSRPSPADVLRAQLSTRERNARGGRLGGRARRPYVVE